MQEKTLARYFEDIDTKTEVDTVSKHVTNQKHILNSDQEIVKLSFNNKVVVKINKKQLLEKSFYFQTYFKPIYIDHKSKLIEVNMQVSNKAFKKVMTYLTVGDVSIHKKNIFEIYQLALYLQIPDLQELCTDYFTYNLKRKDLKNQKKVLSNSSVAYSRFLEIASVFENSGRPTFSGVYFLHTLFGKIRLRMFSRDFKHDHEVCEIDNYEGEKKMEMHYMRNTLVSWILNPSTMQVALLQHDLVTGKNRTISVENTVQVIICCDDKTLFAFSVVKSETNDFLLGLSIFEKSKSSEDIKLCSKRIFDLSPKFKSTDLNVLHLFFAHCADEKLYVFYKQNRKRSYALYDVMIVTICTKNLNILEKKQLIAYKFKFDIETGLKLYSNPLRKLFFFKNKLFIRHSFETTLVFDVSKQYLYSTKKIGVNKHFRKNGWDKSVVDQYVAKDDKVYGIFSYFRIASPNFKQCYEVRQFTFRSNKWKISKKFKTEFEARNINSVQTVCFV